MLSIFDRIKKPTQVVDITNPTYQAILGNYFIGQTEEIIITETESAWAALMNPPQSGVNLFFDIFTISNFSGQPFTAEIWFNPRLPGQVMTSSIVTPSNLTLSPPPKPKIKLQYASRFLGSPFGGVNAFDRIVTANSTLISDSNKGGIITGPGDSFVIFLRSPGKGKIPARVVFSWWEEKVK